MSDRPSCRLPDRPLDWRGPAANGTCQGPPDPARDRPNPPAIAVPFWPPDLPFDPHWVAQWEALELPDRAAGADAPGRAGTAQFCHNGAPHDGDRPTARPAPDRSAANPLPPGELWEFKTVSTRRDLLRDPATFYRLCREEARAGWTLHEKCSDRQARFKRPAFLRSAIDPDRLPFDPYRTVYAPRQLGQRLAIALEHRYSI